MPFCEWGFENSPIWRQNHPRSPALQLAELLFPPGNNPRTRCGIVKSSLCLPSGYASNNSTIDTKRLQRHGGRLAEDQLFDQQGCARRELNPGPEMAGSDDRIGTTRHAPNERQAIAAAGTEPGPALFDGRFGQSRHEPCRQFQQALNTYGRVALVEAGVLFG